MPPQPDSLGYLAFHGEERADEKKSFTRLKCAGQKHVD